MNNNINNINNMNVNEMIRLHLLNLRDLNTNMNNLIRTHNNYTSILENVVNNNNMNSIYNNILYGQNNPSFNTNNTTNNTNNTNNNSNNNNNHTNNHNNSNNNTNDNNNDNNNTNDNDNDNNTNNNNLNIDISNNPVNDIGDEITNVLRNNIRNIFTRNSSYYTQPYFLRYNFPNVQTYEIDLGVVNNNTNFTNNGLPDDEINQYTTVNTFNNIDNQLNITECPISHEEFEDDTNVIQLRCNHIFKENSIRNWLHNNRTCPVCRSLVTQIH